MSLRLRPRRPKINLPAPPQFNTARREQPILQTPQPRHAQHDYPPEVMKGNQEPQRQTENRRKDFRNTERDRSNASRKETGLPRVLNEWAKDLRSQSEIASAVN